MCNISSHLSSLQHVNIRSSPNRKKSASIVLPKANVTVCVATISFWIKIAYLSSIQTL